MNAAFCCREAARLASQAIDRRLSLGQRLALGLHLSVCAACRAYRRQIIAIDRLMRGRSSTIADDGTIRLDPAARQRISEALRRR